MAQQKVPDEFRSISWSVVERLMELTKGPIRSFEPQALAEELKTTFLHEFFNAMDHEYFVRKLPMPDTEGISNELSSRLGPILQGFAADLKSEWDDIVAKYPDGTVADFNADDHLTGDEPDYDARRAQSRLAYALDDMVYRMRDDLDVKLLRLLMTAWQGV